MATNFTSRTKFEEDIYISISGVRIPPSLLDRIAHHRQFPSSHICRSTPRDAYDLVASEFIDSLSVREYEILCKSVSLLIQHGGGLTTTEVSVQQGVSN